MPSLGMKARDTMNKAGVHRKAAHGVKQNPSSLGFTPTKQIGIANQTDILV